MSTDRTAERPRYLCAAYSCPLIGVMTESTKGGDEWYCFCHFGKEAAARDEITFELHRMEWLCRAVTDLRTYRGADRLKVRERIINDLRDNQPLLATFLAKGFIAFEDEIKAGIKAAFDARPKQPDIPLAEPA